MRTGTAEGSIKGGAAWYGFIAVIAGIVYLVLQNDFTINQVMIVAGAGLLFILLLALDTYRVAATALWLAVFLNMANYTFLSYSASGAFNRSAESNLIAYMRLPLVLLIVALVWMRYKGGFKRFVVANGDVMLFGVLAMVSSLFARDKQGALLYGAWMLVSLWALLAYLYVLGSRYQTARWPEHFAWILLLAYVAHVFWTIPGVGNLGQLGQLQGAYAGTNAYAYSAGIVVGSVLVLYRQRSRGAASRWLKKIPVPLLLGTLMAALVIIVLSGKRSVILAAGLAVALYMLLSGASKRRLGRSLVQTAVLGMALLASFWFAAPQATYTTYRFEVMTADGSSVTPADASSQERFENWQRAIERILSYSPVFGGGLNNANRYAGGGLHNTYLGVFVEMGLVGVLCFLVMLFRSYRLFRRRSYQPLRVPNILLGVVPLLVGITEYNLIPGQIIFWPIWIALLMPRLALLQTQGPQS